MGEVAPDPKLPRVRRRVHDAAVCYSPFALTIWVSNVHGDPCGRNDQFAVEPCIEKGHVLVHFAAYLNADWYIGEVRAG